MALPEGLILEYRANGAATNGGGFYDRDPGTSVDYTQQDAAEETWNNLSTDGAGTQVSDASTGNKFTAAMAGNLLYLNGDWYEITNFVDVNTVDIDRSAGASLSGLTGNVGGALSTFTDAFLEIAPDNTIAHIKNDGTYTLLEAILITSIASVSKPIRFRGYNSARDDNPTGDNRPLIACGANTFWFPDAWHFKNFRLTGTATKVFQVDNETVTKNCKVQNTSGTASRVALSAVLSSSSKASQITDCIGISDNGFGIEMAGNVSGTLLVAKDCGVRGISQQTAGTVNLNKCIIYNCATGINIENRTGTRITQCTIDDCSNEGIKMNGASRNITIERCNISNNTIGINNTAATMINTHHIDYNNLFNNGTDRVNINVGDNDFDTDPEYTDAANGDFSISNASNITFTFQEAETQDTFNPGAAQSISAAGGETAFGCVG